jgi:hypothetical protein
MTVLLPHGALPKEDRLIFTPETAEPLGVSPPKAVDLLSINIAKFADVTEASNGRVARFGVETMKEAPVSRVTWDPVAAVPSSIDFGRHPCSTSVSISTTSAWRSASSSRPGPRSYPEVRRGASQRRGVEWERPNTFAWCSAKADDAEWMSGKSRHRLAPVLTEASFMDVGPKRARSLAEPTKFIYIYRYRY